MYAGSHEQRGVAIRPEKELLRRTGRVGSRASHSEHEAADGNSERRAETIKPVTKHRLKYKTYIT